MKRKIYPIFLALLLTSITIQLSAQPARDGKIFDQGHGMTEKSPRAHEQLDNMKNLLGQWDVSVTTYPTDSTTFSSKGIAEITYMNRGYGYMSRVHIPSYDDAGLEANLIHFLTYSPSNNTWVLGEANSYTESISMYNGDLKGKKLRLSTAIRQGGGALVTAHRVAYDMKSDKKFSITQSVSTDNGRTWTPAIQQEYVRRDMEDNFMVSEHTWGEPASDRPAAADGFDFLIGEWNASHSIYLNGQWIQFPTNATAVYALNGHAILEHSWFNVDPSLPDAATSIVRLYNRSMRRWESLYLNNRGNSPLFFGGQKEGEDVVLHSFETNSSSSVIPQYVFHDIKKNSYAWYAENSSDRGKTFNKTWKIEFKRK